MSSLFEHLLVTLPFQAALQAAVANYLIPTHELTAAQLSQLLRYLPAGTSYEARIPDIEPQVQDALQDAAARDLDGDLVKVQGLWSWKYDASQPHRVSSIYCRTRDADFIPQCVLQSVEWGLEDPIDDFRPVVRITGTDGRQYELPLTPDFMKQTWVTIAGWTAPDGHWLWPLETLQDRGLVVAFIYEIDPNDGSVIPFVPEGEELERWNEVEEAARDLAEHIPMPPPEDSSTSDGQPEFKGSVPWLLVGGQGEVMGNGSPEDTPQGEIGGTVAASASRPRILVMLSLATCRERGQFEPVDVVGVARIFPNLIVKASIPLEKIEATARLERPVSTLRDGGAEVAGCCRSFDATDGVIRPLLVTDSNDNDLATLPHWSNLFQYYLVDPHVSSGSEIFHVVRSDQAFERSDDTGLVERQKVVWGDVSTVTKAPRQGEFDNVHMAPRLRFVRCPSVRVTISSYERAAGPFPVDRSALHLDDIAMAPFCAHDCFHLHWRWSTTAKGKWTLGWDESGPSRAAGAPLVPPSQDVDVWFRGANSLSYHVIVGPEMGEPEIRPLSVHPMMHHGAAYAVATTGHFMDWMSKIAVNSLEVGVEFLDESGNMISSADSTSLFYWRLRYRLEVSDDGSLVRAVERLAIHDLPGARSV